MPTVRAALWWVGWSVSVTQLMAITPPPQMAAGSCWELLQGSPPGCRLRPPCPQAPTPSDADRRPSVSEVLPRTGQAAPTSQPSQPPLSQKKKGCCHLCLPPEGSSSPHTPTGPTSQGSPLPPQDPGENKETRST